MTLLDIEWRCAESSDLVSGLYLSNEDLSFGEVCLYFSSCNYLLKLLWPSSLIIIDPPCS